MRLAAKAGQTGCVSCRVTDTVTPITRQLTQPNTTASPQHRHHHWRGVGPFAAPANLRNATSRLQRHRGIEFAARKAKANFGPGTSTRRM